MSKENVGKFWEWYSQHKEMEKKLEEIQRQSEAVMVKGLMKLGAEAKLPFTEDELKSVMAERAVYEPWKALEGVAGGTEHGGGDHNTKPAASCLYPCRY